MKEQELNAVKQRFSIIGNSEQLNRAIDIAVQVAPTDLSVLITGESGVGKENFPQIIHNYGHRKHGPYIAVNCGAIPEGTIDSELFGHEKGSFTGATGDRKGYFEVANGGTIFLDEVGELPSATQVRLLRVLEAGEFIKVGSSKIQKTNVRVVAATNMDMTKAIVDGRFREDLYYRLNTIPILVPPLRERKEDIPLLFRKFAGDFAEKYNMPPIRLTNKAREMVMDYYWNGNVRQLKNITEQISIIEQQREISPEILRRYLPEANMHRLPAVASANSGGDKSFSSEREILYQILFDMKRDMSDLKKNVQDLMNERQTIMRTLNIEDSDSYAIDYKGIEDFDEPENVEEVIVEEKPPQTMAEREKEIIRELLEKHRGRKKNAAKELGISERTLYRKIKDYNLEN